MAIPKLKGMVFVELSLFDLVVATQVCQEWQNSTLSSTKLRDRLLYGKLPSQYLVTISQVQGAYVLSARSSLPEYPKLEWLVRIPQKAFWSHRWIDGTLVVLRQGQTCTKLLIWNDAEFQLPRSVKATLLQNGCIYWARLGCLQLLGQHLPSPGVVGETSRLPQNPFLKQFIEMLQ
jgi:hypothetical protein